MQRRWRAPDSGWRSRKCHSRRITAILPGRFQIVSESPLFLMSHNPHARNILTGVSESANEKRARAGGYRYAGHDKDITNLVCWKAVDDQPVPSRPRGATAEQPFEHRVTANDSCAGIDAMADAKAKTPCWCVVRFHTVAHVMGSD